MLPTTAEIELKILDPRVREFQDAETADNSWPLPAYESKLAAGVDLRAMIKEDSITLKPHETYLMPTGIAVFIGNPNICATVLPRSGLGFKSGIVLGNLVGLVDADYQGPLMVPLWNRSDKEVTIKVGERIAQMVFVPIVKANFKVVSEFTAPTARGTAGFGSTGS